MNKVSKHFLSTSLGFIFTLSNAIYEAYFCSPLWLYILFAMKQKMELFISIYEEK